MALTVLTAVTTFDIPSNTQNIVFNNPSQIDEIDFANNAVTVKAHSSFSVSKADFMTYFHCLNLFNTALFQNFPSINASINLATPVSEYNYKVGSTRITYLQTTTASAAVMDLTYLFSNSTMTFAALGADKTITLQEFFTMIYLLTQITKQVSLH
jgi:hypothetical protein